MADDLLLPVESRATEKDAVVGDEGCSPTDAGHQRDIPPLGHEVVEHLGRSYGPPPGLPGPL